MIVQWVSSFDNNKVKTETKYTLIAIALTKKIGDVSENFVTTSI